MNLKTAFDTTSYAEPNSKFFHEKQKIPMGATHGRNITKKKKTKNNITEKHFCLAKRFFHRYTYVQWLMHQKKYLFIEDKIKLNVYFFLIDLNSTGALNKILPCNYKVFCAI